MRRSQRRLRKPDSGAKERRNGGTDDQDKEEDFQALEIYKLARAIRKKFYALAKGLPEEDKYLLKPQIFDASRSLTNNIAEEYIIDLKTECCDLRKRCKRYISYLRRSKVGWEEIGNSRVEDEG